MITRFPTYPGPWSDTTISQAFLSALAAGQPLSIPANIDRAQLAAWLDKHELAALAYRHLDKQETIAHQLASIYWASASANELKLALLESLLTAFAAAGIKCVLLKGIAFCLTIYPEAAVRPMSDLDLWIQRRDWPHVWPIMQEVGYETEKLWPGPQTVPNHVTTVEFFPRQSMAEDFLSVEIHSDLIAHPTHLIGRFPLVAWWERTLTQVWRGHTLHLLDPAAALLHTAVHQMFQHSGQLRLRWLLDVDQLVRGTASYHLTATDWQRLSEEAAQAGVLPALQSTLQITQKWFNTPLPEPALVLLAQASNAGQHSFFQQMVVPQQSTAVRVWRDVQGIPNSRARFTYLRQKLFPNTAYMMERYRIPSRWLLPFFYIRRWGKAFQMIRRQE